jgi:HEAT repeat protein
MKHFKLIILCLSLFLASNIQAQAPQGRTDATIIADALAQLPAETPQNYNQIISDLVSTGEKGLLDLIGRMNPPGNKSNESLDFAIDGWIDFVATDNAKRTVALSALVKALSQPLDKEVKAFVIRQLRKIATDDNVDALSLFLNDDYLGDDASQALVSIGTEKANEALLNALTGAGNDQIRLNLVNALGQTDYRKAEPLLLDMLRNNPSEEMQKVILNALGNTGTKESLDALKEAAAKTDFTYQKSTAATSYLTLLNRLNDNEPKLVQKEARKLLSTASRQNNQGLKTAAAQLLLAQPSVNKVKFLKDAIKDGNITYLTALLNAYPFQNDKKSMQLALNELSSTKSPQVQTALIYWLAEKEGKNALPQIIRFVNASDKMVQKAALLSLVKISGEEALVALAGLLRSDNKETVAMAQNALSAYNGDISYTLASVFNECGDEGKVAILKLIANRKMESQYNLVYNQMFTDNATVKAEAARTLKDVATDTNLPDMFTLLEQSEATYVPAIQQAINGALNDLPESEQLQQVTARMDRSAKKHLYYRALANSRTQDALVLITQAYETESGTNKDAAFDALSKWNAFNVIYPLLDIARNSSDNQELGKVTDALITTIAGSDETGAVKYLYLREAMAFAQNSKQKNEIIKLMGNTGQYQAMLFVAPFMDQAETSEVAAVAAMTIALNNPSFAGAETTKILNKVSKTLKNPDADYQRQSITKFLSENTNDGGYHSIFNGRNLDGWKGLVENPLKRASMTRNELAQAQQKADKEAAESWIVEDGVLLFTGKGNNLCTDKLYGDFDMLVDWKLYEGPEPDAGIYLRGTPQVQIWDTARVNVGAQVGSGGLYNNQQNPSKPLKVADQKLEEWNTFRIRMIGDRVSVWLNGVLVTDNVILENYWDRSQPIFPMEQIELQAHGSKVAYRDIFINELERREPFELSEQEKKDEFEVLFDGTNMHHWTGNTSDYIIEEGVIAVYPAKNNSGGNRNLYTKKEYDNFVFRFEFMLPAGANNGLGIRTPMEGDAAYQGMELQILDNEAPVYSKLKEYQYHGSVYGVIPAKRGFLKPVGEWNYQEVIADGDHIKVILNGTTILDGNIREAAKNGTADGKDHPGLFNKKGHIGFLGHGSVVKFKNIRIKELK